jgi:glycerate dehydrogenase
MKDGVILLNTARGGLIHEQDLAEALISGKVRYFAADVVSAEPILPTNPLLAAPNCILTPHIAWTPVEARQRIIDITNRNIRAYLDGEPINVVN